MESPKAITQPVMAAASARRACISLRRKMRCRCSRYRSNSAPSGVRDYPRGQRISASTWTECWCAEMSQDCEEWSGARDQRQSRPCLGAATGGPVTQGPQTEPQGVTAPRTGDSDDALSGDLRGPSRPNPRCNITAPQASCFRKRSGSRRPQATGLHEPNSRTSGSRLQATNGHYREMNGIRPPFVSWRATRPRSSSSPIGRSWL